MGSSTMDSLKDMENFTLQREITILASLDLIRKKVEEFILGQANKVTCMRENSKLEKETGEELSGGQMVAGTKETLEMEFKVVGECFIEKEGIENTRATGIMGCLMAKAHNTSKTANAMKVHLNKTSSMVKEYFTKTTL